MREEKLAELRTVFKPLEEEVGSVLKAVAVYGSAARKEMVEGSDIDVLVILDDTHDDFENIKYKIADKIIDKIEEENEKLKLHIQPPKLLTHFWELMLEGEPWTLTAIKDMQPIYDPSGIVETLNSVSHIDSGSRKEIKSAKMLSRSKENLEEIKQSMEDSVKFVEENVWESFDTVLMCHGLKPANKDIEKLKEELVDERELLQKESLEKLNGIGELNSFKPSEVDKQFEKGLELSETLVDLFNMLQRQEKEWIIKETFAEMKETCETTLESKGIETDTPLETFQEEVALESFMSDEYAGLIEKVKQMHEMLEDDNLDEIDRDTVDSSAVKVKDFKSAVSRVIEGDFEPVKVKEKVESPNSYSAALNLQTQFLEKPSFKASWVLSVDSLSKTDEITIVFLVTEEKTELKEEIKSEARRIEEKQGFKVNSSFMTLENYWRKLRTGDSEIIKELRGGTTLYDPEGLFYPVKNIIEKGRLEGTREDTRKQLLESSKELAENRNSFKHKTVNQCYEASVEAGQALLLAHGYSFPAQKRTADKVEKHLVPDEVSQETADKIQKNISFWKDIEHGKENTVNPGEIDLAVERTNEIISETEKKV